MVDMSSHRHRVGNMQRIIFAHGGILSTKDQSRSGGHAGSHETIRFTNENNMSLVLHRYRGSGHFVAWMPAILKHS